MKAFSKQNKTKQIQIRSPMEGTIINIIYQVHNYTRESQDSFLSPAHLPKESTTLPSSPGYILKSSSISPMSMSLVTQRISKINQAAFHWVLPSACPISAQPSYEGIKLKHSLTWAQRNPFMSSVCWVTGTCLRLQGLLLSSEENSSWSISAWTEMNQEKMTHEYIRWRRRKHNMQGQHPKKHPEKDKRSQGKLINMQDSKIKIRSLKKRQCFFKWKTMHIFVLEMYS